VHAWCSDRMLSPQAQANLRSRVSVLLCRHRWLAIAALAASRQYTNLSFLRLHSLYEWHCIPHRKAKARVTGKKGWVWGWKNLRWLLELSSKNCSRDVLYHGARKLSGPLDSSSTSRSPHLCVVDPSPRRPICSVPLITTSTLSNPLYARGFGHDRWLAPPLSAGLARVSET
jgi:hypothetical protein